VNKVCTAAAITWLAECRTISKFFSVPGLLSFELISKSLACQKAKSLVNYNNLKV
jgi:hypothetical protein